MNSRLKTLLYLLVDQIAIEMADDAGILDDEQPDWAADHREDAIALLQTYIENNKELI